MRPAARIGERLRRRAWLAVLVLLVLLPGLSTPAGASARARGAWIRLETENFVLVSNAGRRRSAAIARSLEALRDVLSRTSRGLRVQSPLPTTIHLFRAESHFRPYNLGTDGKPEHSSGYFVSTPDGNYVALDLAAGDEPFRGIYHEYLHDFMRHNVPDLPLWLSEGLAEYYSTFEADGARAEIGRHVEAHLAWLARRDLIPLDELFAMDTSSTGYHEGDRQGTFYAQSWALTHYLLSGDEERRKRMGRYLERLNRGEEPIEAFLTTYETDLVTLGAALADYVRQRSYRFYEYRFDEAIAAHEPTVEPMERADVLVRLGDLLAHRPPVQFASAEAHITEALAIAPEHPGAYEVLGILRDLQGKLDEARRYYENAIRLAPDSARAASLYGRTYLREFHEGDTGAPGATPPLLLEARRLLRRSLALDPEYPESLVGLGKSYLYEQGDVSEGVGALARAVQLLPSRNDARIALIVLTANSGNLEGAWSLLASSPRLRSDEELLRSAEEAIAAAGVLEVERLFRAGSYDAAKQRLAGLARRPGTPELRERLAAQAAELDRRIEANRLIARFNEAVDLLRAGDLNASRALFEEVAAAARETDLGQAAAEKLGIIEEMAHRARLASMYEEARRLHGEGDADGARGLLEEILRSDPDDELREHVIWALERLRAQP